MGELTPSIKEFTQGNFLLTKRIVDLVNEINPSVKFINISSMSILASNEDYASINKMSDYAYSKFISEQYCIRINLEKSTNIRFSTIFYGDETRDGISKLIFDSITKNEITIYNDGTASRDIIPINILCDYLFKITKLDHFEKKMNIVSGNKTTFSMIVDLLKKQNNQLKINNINANFTDILADFPKDSILKIGEIPFDLEAALLTYYNTVSEVSNLQ